MDGGTNGGSGGSGGGLKIQATKPAFDELFEYDDANKTVVTVKRDFIISLYYFYLRFEGSMSQTWSGFTRFSKGQKLMAVLKKDYAYPIMDGFTGNASTGAHYLLKIGQNGSYDVVYYHDGSARAYGIIDDDTDNTQIWNVMM